MGSEPDDGHTSAAFSRQLTAQATKQELEMDSWWLIHQVFIYCIYVFLCTFMLICIFQKISLQQVLQIKWQNMQSAL